MFNGNKKISSSQIFKGFFCASICSSILLLLYNYTNATEFFITFLFTFIFSLIISFFTGKCLKNHIPFNAEYYKAMSSVNKLFSRIIAVFILIKYMVTMLIILYLIYFTLYKVLQINISNIFIALLLFFLCLYISKSGIEKISRLAEILFYIILIPLLILIVTTAFKVSPDKLIHSLTAVKNSSVTIWGADNSISLFKVAVSSIMLSIILFPLEITIPLRENANNKACPHKALFNSLLTVFGFIVILSLIIIGIFGNISTDYTVHPLFSLMQMSSLNTNFSARLDSLVCIFIFSGLIYSLSYYLHFTSETIRLIIPKSKKRVYVIPLFIVFLAAISFLPFTPKTSFTKSPSDRAIIENIIIDENNNIYFEIYNSSNENKLYNTHSASILEAEEYFSNNEKLVLDFSHIQAIFVPNELFNDNASLKDLLLSYKKDLRFLETMEIKNIAFPAESLMLYTIFINEP